MEQASTDRNTAFGGGEDKASGQDRFLKKKTPFPIQEGSSVYVQGPGRVAVPIDQIYWTKNVALEGADRLPALSTAMSVIVLSPVWVTYTTARSPVVAWSRTPFR
jgi:hypothetical protein